MPEPRGCHLVPVFGLLLGLATACSQPSVSTIHWQGAKVRLEVATTEVSQELYQQIMGENPSHLIGARLPVDSVTWHQAVEFCDLLSLREGLNPCYGQDVVVDRRANGWRLPSPEEWSLLAQASADPAQAWYANNSERSTHPVGTKEPNALGLYDMAANVWEWCDNGDPNQLQADRGGGYRSNLTLLGPAGRGDLGPGSFGDDLGFRVVRSQR